jgi:DNA repair photolyase
MPQKYEEMHVKSALGDLGVLNTRFWTKHCFDPYVNCGINCVYCNTSTRQFKDGAEQPVKVCAKTNAPPILAKELAGLKKRGMVAIGLAMDAYQPVERELGLTRRVLQVLKDYNTPFSLGTKSDMVLRDLDIISEASKKSPCLISLSVTTLDEDFAKIMEPNASTPQKRLQAVQKLSDAGVNTGVWFSPILPFITDNDENLEGVIKASAEHGAKYILAGALDTRSILGIKKFLGDRYPHLLPKYEAIYRKPDGSYLYYPNESYMYPLYKKLFGYCKKYRIEHFMPHFAARSQAMLFYIRQFGISNPSLTQLLPVLNYLSPSQEILQNINLLFKNTAFTRSTLKTLGYFPH